MEDNKELLDFMKDALDGKVKAVRLSQRLKSHPVCITSEGAITLEMEKVLNAMPATDKVQAQRVLELNANHPIFQKLTQLYNGDQEKLKTYTQILYTQAMMIEGFPWKTRWPSAIRSASSWKTDFLQEPPCHLPAGRFLQFL